MAPLSTRLLVWLSLLSCLLLTTSYCQQPGATPTSGDPINLLAQQRDAPAADQAQQQAISLYRQPSNWLVGLLREFFDDIDWQTIGNATQQIEKFIRKVDRLVGSVRVLIGRANGGTQRQPQSAAAPWPWNLLQTSPARLAGRSASPSSRWWSSSGWGKATPSDDATSVKGMLERVACFVGYIRLMNLSNEALAELDASKVVSNLFGSNKLTNSSSWSNWFG